MLKRGGYSNYLIGQRPAQAVTVAWSGEVDNPRRAALMKRGGGVRKAQVGPDVASGSELILALADDLITLSCEDDYRWQQVQVSCVLYV